MILEKARELGIALSESDEFINMTRTREAMEADTQLMDELNEYNAMQESIARLLTMDGDNQAEIQQMRSAAHAGGDPGHNGQHRRHIRDIIDER